MKPPKFGLFQKIKKEIQDVCKILKDCTWKAAKLMFKWRRKVKKGYFMACMECILLAPGAFCMQCGRRAKFMPITITCPDCGQPIIQPVMFFTQGARDIPDHNNFCPFCGLGHNVRDAVYMEWDRAPFITKFDTPLNSELLPPPEEDRF